LSLKIKALMNFSGFFTFLLENQRNLLVEVSKYYFTAETLKSTTNHNPGSEEIDLWKPVQRREHCRDFISTCCASRQK